MLDLEPPGDATAERDQQGSLPGMLRIRSAAASSPERSSGARLSDFLDLVVTHSPTIPARPRHSKHSPGCRLEPCPIVHTLLLEEANPLAAHLKKELVMGASLGRIRHRSTSMAREYYAVFAAAFAFATDLAFPSASCCALTEGGTGITGWSLCVSAVGSV